MSYSSAARPSLRGAFAVPVLVLAACADATTPLEPEIAAPAMSATAPNRPVRLEFAKCLADPTNFVWEGAVSGDIDGDLTTVLTDLRVTGPVWHVRFDWIISANERSFVADLRGILNTRTGTVVMSGLVTNGSAYLAGAQVQERGILVDPENSCFEGTIRIMPATTP